MGLLDSDWSVDDDWDGELPSVDAYATIADPPVTPGDHTALAVRPFRENGGTIITLGLYGCVMDESPWRDRDTLHQAYVIEGRTQYEIADEFGCTQANIAKWVKRHGLTKENPPTPWRDEETLKRLYVAEGLYAREVAERLDCSVSTIERWLSIHAISDIDDSNAPEELLNEAWLREKYQTMSTLDIADVLGCSHRTVEKYLLRHGIETRGTPPIIRPLDDAETLREWYVEEELPSDEIAEKVGCSPQAVRNWLRTHEIELRDPIHLRPPRTGPDHPRFRHGIREYGQTWYLRRRDRLEFDNYQCVVCGMGMEEHVQKYGRALSVHHIIKKEEFRNDDGSLDEERAHDIGNLLTLCREHHDLWEGIPLRPEVTSNGDSE